MHVRIRELANLFPRGCSLVDVGSDHGYLGLLLLKEEKAPSVVNIDLSKDAIHRSEKVYKKGGYANRAVFMVNDGFTGLVELPKNSVVVISGMGTSQILKILERMPENVEHLILLSHTDYYQIRKWAFANSFFVKNERYVDDGELVYLILDLVKKDIRVHSKLRDYIFGREEFWRGSQRGLFEKYWIRNSRRIFNIPIEFRNNVEQEILKVLKEESII